MTITPKDGIVAKQAAPKKSPAKTELTANIAAATDMSEKQVAAVLEALTAEIRKSLGNKGAGVITIPGVVAGRRRTRSAK